MNINNNQNIKTYLETVSAIYKNNSFSNFIEEKNQETSKLFENYLYINPRGQLASGVSGLYYWSKKQNLDFVKTALEYLEINKPYDKLRQNNFINATAKAKGVFGDDLQLDEMYFCEFYKIPRFGKTRVGQLLLHSKLTENQKYIQIICDEFSPKIREFAKNFDCICFVPPSKSRQVQFMDILDKTVNSSIPRVKAYKKFEDMVIQQKTISNRNDRIESARETIFIDNIDQKFQSCLIIDDAIASGSTLNEIARKLRTQNIVTGKIVGLGIVGNLNDSKKGYDVINEV
jgi:hypothetical protein